MSNRESIDALAKRVASYRGRANAREAGRAAADLVRRMQSGEVPRDLEGGLRALRRCQRAIERL